MREDFPLAEARMTVAPGPADAAPTGTGAVEPPPFGRWLVDQPRWEIYFGMTWAACFAIVQAGPITSSGRIIAGAALAAMVPWYIWVGRPAMEKPDPNWRLAAFGRGSLYLAGLLILFGIAQSFNPNTWFLTFVICPQCFAVTNPRRGMVFVVAFNAVAGALYAWHTPGVGGALTALGIVVFATGFSYVYSRWIIRVIDQSLERAMLIQQLESTRAELAEAHHEAGVLAERHRLAGEIHDTLAQGFTSIVTLLQAAQPSLPQASPVRRHVDLALAAARENLAEARTLVSELTPAALEAAPLGETVHRVTEATAAEAGISARAEVTGSARALPTKTEVVLLRVCQEALANVRKHAGAQQVTVQLCYAPEAVRLTVTDDGRGFDPGVAAGGYGLRGMRDRVGQVGGTVEVTSAPGAGAEVRVEVPA
jgi:signal transduction histidine kinase